MSNPFNGRMVVFGAGAICQCALPIVLDRVTNCPEKVIVVEMDERKKAGIAACLARGVRFETVELEEDMLPQFLAERLSEGDVLFDLAWEIDTVFLLSWCHSHGVIYLNTSLEVWDPTGDAISNNPHPKDRTLYQRHQGIYYDLRCSITKYEI